MSFIFHLPRSLQWTQPPSPFLALISGALLIPCFSLLGFSSFEPIFSLVLFSFSYTLGPVALISGVSLILDVSVVGTALGVYKCASNIGTTMVGPLVGAVQDHYDGEYHEVMMILIGFAVLSTIAGAIFLAVDHMQLKKLLSLGANKRKHLVEAKTFDEVAPKVSMVQTYIYGIISGVLLVTSWAIYIALVVVSSE